MNDTTVSHLAALAEALGTVDAGWHAALGGSPSSAVIDDDLDAMSDAGLLALNDALGAVERYSQVLHAKVASGISRRSTPELGKEGLARKAGFKTPAKLIAAATGGHTAEAQRLIQVGEATAGRITFSGERAPARHPHVAEAFTRGRLSRDAASAITGFLDKLFSRIDRTVLDAAEQTLAQQAQGLALADVQVILRRAEAWLDPDGLEPKIEDLRAAQYLKIREDANGMIVFDGKFSPDNGAPIKAAVEGLVTAQIRAARGRNDAGASGDGAGQWAWDVAGAGEAGADAGAVIAETRSIPQLNADALVAICKHVLGCDETVLPLAATTVVVRIPLEALTTGTGVATIDGIAQPIDAGTARRMAADAEVIPIVLGTDSEVLDVGRKRRLFSRAQRLALWERDGGCASCGAPPAMTEAHHIDWWSQGGRTDLGNGVLLCTGCHHTIHRDGWEIRIDGRDVWLIPPAHIDPARTPRLGGRRRFDYRRAA